MDLYPNPLINLLIWVILLGVIYMIARYVPFLEDWMVKIVGIVCAALFLIIVIRTMSSIALV